MNHPAEVAIHSFLQNVMLGKTSMDKDTLDLVSKDVRDALSRQFSGEKRVLNFVCLTLDVRNVSCGLKRITLMKRYLTLPTFLST